MNSISSERRAMGGAFVRMNNFTINMNLARGGVGKSRKHGKKRGGRIKKRVEESHDAFALSFQQIIWEWREVRHGGKGDVKMKRKSKEFCSERRTETRKGMEMKKKRLKGKEM